MAQEQEYQKGRGTDNGKLTVECEECRQWIHGTCVGISTPKLASKYRCDNRNGDAIHANLPQCTQMCRGRCLSKRDMAFVTTIWCCVPCKMDSLSQQMTEQVTSIREVIWEMSVRPQATQVELNTSGTQGCVRDTVCSHCLVCLSLYYIGFSEQDDAQHVGDKHVDDQHVDDQHVDDQHVDDQHVDDQHVDDQHVDDKHVDDQHVADQHVDDKHVDDQHVDDQHVDDQHVDDQHVDDQHVDGQHVDDQHVDDQHVDDLNTSMTNTSMTNTSMTRVNHHFCMFHSNHFYNGFTRMSVYHVFYSNGTYGRRLLYFIVNNSPCIDTVFLKSKCEFMLLCMFRLI